MFDLDQVAFLFACPECRFDNSATVRQLRIGSRVICRGCKKELRLFDAAASFKIARQRVSEEIASFGKALKMEIKV